MPGGEGVFPECWHAFYALSLDLSRYDERARKHCLHNVAQNRRCCHCGSIFPGVDLAAGHHGRFALWTPTEDEKKEELNHLKKEHEKKKRGAVEGKGS